MVSREFSIENLAGVVSKSWEEFRNWYEYMGGKQYYKKQEQAEKREAMLLVETKMISSVWIDRWQYLDPYSLVELERCIYLTLQIEWGEEANCFFDYEKSQILFKSEKYQIIFGDKT